MSAADVAGRECWCAVLPARTRVVQSRHLVRGPGATALGRSDLATPGSARLRNHMHGISLLPIAQPGCKLEDTSTEAAPTQRQLGVYDGDPTIDLVLPPRSFLAVRPLTDDEIAVCRSFSLQTLTATRQPAAWALAAATARTSELPHIVVSGPRFHESSGLDPRELQGGGSLGFLERLGRHPAYEAGRQPEERPHGGSRRRL